MIFSFRRGLAASRPPVDMRGRVCAVTGANSGIGFETALGLARMGATVAMVCRNATRGHEARERVARESGNPQVHLVLADLGLRAEVRRAAGALLERFDRLDVLVNNAAAFSWRRRETAEGIEMQLAVNHLAPFLLTRLLLERLRASAPARVVTVSSGAHHDAAPRWNDLQLRRGYRGWRAYANTKLYNLLFTRELARRLEGTGVTANAVHPGAVGTPLVFGGFRPLRLIRPLLRTPEEGARTVLYLATARDLSTTTGRYFKDDQPRDPSPLAFQDTAADRLWRESELLTGLA